MDAQLRRECILNEINRQNKPVAASLLAEKLNVSRQVIVGDVALLRAKGHEIIATSRGYIIQSAGLANQYLGKIACCHAPEETKNELYIVVDLGATVVNVTVEHGFYGEITGCLNLASREDVDAFIDKVDSSEIKLLSELAMGVHLHTIACRDKPHFEEVCSALEASGYLY